MFCHAHKQETLIYIKDNSMSSAPEHELQNVTSECDICVLQIFCIPDTRTCAELCLWTIEHPGKMGRAPLMGRMCRQASGKAEQGRLFVQLHRSVKEAAVLTLDEVQRRIKPPLASVSLLFGQTDQKGMNSLVDPLRRANESSYRLNCYAMLSYDINTLLCFLVFTVCFVL